MRPITVAVLLATLLCAPAPSREMAAAAPASCQPVTPSALGGSTGPMALISNTLGFKIFDRLYSTVDQGNLFLSPVSAAVALSLLYDGARGNTAADVSTTLGVGALSRGEVLSGAAALLASLHSSDPNVRLGVVSSVWARAGVKLRKAFLGDARRFFGAGVATLRFASPAAPTRINAWAACATHGAITRMVDRISANLVMLLFNAVYFNGAWTTSFDPTLTRHQTFTTSNGDQISVPMMSLAATTLRYTAGSNFEAVALPYGNGRFEMVLVLPQNGMSLQLLAPHLSDALWRHWTSGLKPTKIDLSIPKFTLSNDWNLDSPLSALGMAGAFGSAGNFKGVCSRCKLSVVRQKTYLRVDERGTTGAAVSGAGITTTIAPARFVADHPFLLAIRDSRTAAILFLGAINSPQS